MQQVDGWPAAEDDDQDAGDEAKDGAEGLPVRAVVAGAVEGVVAGEYLVGSEAGETGRGQWVGVVGWSCGMGGSGEGLTQL